MVKVNMNMNAVLMFRCPQSLTTSTGYYCYLRFLFLQIKDCFLPDASTDVQSLSISADACQTGNVKYKENYFV